MILLLFCTVQYKKGEITMTTVPFKVELREDVELEKNDKIKENRMHHFWHGGIVVTLKHKGYKFRIEAIGDVGCTLYEDKEELAFVKDEANRGSFYNVMDTHIKNDEELQKILDNETETGKHLNIENNNWWECFIVDKEGNFHDVMWDLDADTIKEAIEEVQINMDRIINVLKFIGESRRLIKNNNSWWECFIIDKECNFQGLMWNMDSDLIKEVTEEVQRGMKHTLKRVSEDKNLIADNINLWECFFVDKNGITTPIHLSN